MEDTNGWTDKEIIESKATDQESDDDEYWDTMTDIDENEVIRNDDSDEETFWESPTEPEDITETEIPVTYNIDMKNEFDPASMWDNQHTSKVRETVPKANNTTKKMCKLRKDFLTNIILLSVVIGRCATAKSIEGLPVENKIEKGNLPNGYFVEQSRTEMIIEKIDEEVIQAFDCMEESMASAEISLNPPSECKLEDGSAYHRPIKKRAQILEMVRRIPVNITTCMIQWRVNVGWCGGEFAIES